jgi:hypothetical protein
VQFATSRCSRNYYMHFVTSTRSILQHNAHPHTAHLTSRKTEKSGVGSAPSSCLTSGATTFYSYLKDYTRAQHYKNCEIQKQHKQARAVLAEMPG